MGQKTDKRSMSVEQLDYLFPFVVFAYGAIMTFTLNFPQLMVLAEKHFPQNLLKQMMAHRVLALVSLIVGSLWSLQNLWLS